MVNPKAHLVTDPFTSGIERRPTRDGFGTGVVLAGRADAQVVVLCADLKESTRAEAFEKEFPDRYIEMGVAEQNMAGIASGMAAIGKVPFTLSYACFNPGRNYEQIRTLIALNAANVKVCGMHAGVSVGADGATHQMLEDLGMMRMLPGMTVLAPADALEAEKAILAAAGLPGPVYLRFGRAATPLFTTAATPFVIGKALPLWSPPPGGDAPRVALLATGPQSHDALLAAHALRREKIETLVLHLPTVKPLDEEAVLEAARRAGRVVTVEEHQAAGGFGSAVAELLGERHPVPMRRVGVRDLFGQSGEPEQLAGHYGLDAKAIVAAARQLVSANG